MKRTKSIIVKLSLLIISVFVILFVLFASITSYVVHKETVRNAEEISLADAERVALRLSEQFRQTDESLHTTKRVLESMNASEQLTATDILDVLHANLEGNPNAIGMAAIFEKGVLSTDDLSTEQQQLIDAEGRFTSYLLKTKTGTNIIPASGYEQEGEGDWYLVPKREKKAFFQEPITYEENGKTSSFTMLSVPLLAKDGSFMGVLTTSMSLDYFEELTKKIAPKSGYAAVITDSGTLLQNSIKKEMNGTNMKDAIDWQPVKDLLMKGESVAMYVDSQSLGEQAYNSFAPIHLEGFEETWTVQTVIPRSEVTSLFSAIVKIIIWAGFVMMVLMGLVTAGFIYRQIKPLTTIQQSMKRAASGDLTESVDENGLKLDEIGSVTQSYNFMLRQTNDALSEVLQASHQLSDSSKQVNHAFEEIVASSEEVTVATEEIAQGATKQSEDTEETSMRIGELADRINKIADLSGNIDTLSRQSIESTQEGMAQVSRLRTENGVANELNAQVETQMHMLTDKIAGINKIITSIQDITAQTNLLALNASIEAARAGEHGKGFAVVAEEVRKLAEQSNRETTTIQQTVQEILEQSKVTVDVVGKNTQSMENQNESVVSTEQSFIRNAALTEEMSQAIEELADNLQEMIAQKEKAIAAIQNVSAVSEETAASAEQVSASSVAQQQELERVADSVQSMTQIAVKLQQVVDRFTLKGTEEPN